MRATIHTLLCLLFSASLLVSCYSHDRKGSVVASKDSIVVAVDSLLLQRQQDSIWFSATHHYTTNYNFVVSADSLRLFVQQPEEIVSRNKISDNEMWATELHPIDSLMIAHGDRIVVAEIRVMPIDSIDSVWVQLARDQYTFGWIHESELLEQVEPDDPISQFISLFSDVHLLWMIIVVVVSIVVYTFRIVKKKRSKIVHFNDIPSFYPTLLVLVISFAATFYATIQVFAPEMWRHFYFHPTLNPFGVPLLLSGFLTLVWLIPIVAVATVDEVRRHLALNDMLLYLGGLAAVCMVDYIVFSVSTLWFVGYPLLIAYIYFSIKTFNKHRRLVYYCGKCGRAIHRKGRCPHCGTLNE